MENRAQDVVFLKGPRVYLRPPTKADIPCFLRWFNDEEIQEYGNMFLPFTEMGEEEWLHNLHKKMYEDIVLVIVDTKSGQPIGTMGLHRISWKDRRAYTGAMIGEKEFWGKGYGTEAKMLLLHYAFHTLNLRKICSTVFAFNGRSRAYNEKCGYQVEGVLREQTYKKGVYVDEVLMAVFKDDWLPLWEKFKETLNA